MMKVFPYAKSQLIVLYCSAIQELVFNWKKMHLQDSHFCVDNSVRFLRKGKMVVIYKTNVSILESEF